MTTIINVFNKKGGIGKTTTTVNLAVELAQNHNKKILVVDLDDSKNLTKPLLNDDYFYTSEDVLRSEDFNPEQAIYPANTNGELIPNIDVMPSSLELSMFVLDTKLKLPFERLSVQLKKVKEKYDFIFLDCPPTMNIFSIMASQAANFFLIPTTYEVDSLDAIGDLFKIMKGLRDIPNFSYKILRNKYHPSKKTLHRYTYDTLEDFVKKGLVFDTIIEEDEEINKTRIYDIPLLYTSPESRSAKSYAALAVELKELIDA